MSYLIQILVATALVATGWVFAARQFRILSAALANRKLRSVVLELCDAVVDDYSENDEAKKMALRIARLSLNDKMLRIFAEASYHHHLGKNVTPEKWPTRNEATISYLNTSLKGVAMMILAYHPKTGAHARRYIRTISFDVPESNKARLPVEAVVTTPRDLKKDAKELMAAICGSLTDRPLAA